MKRQYIMAAALALMMPQAVSVSAETKVHQLFLLQRFHDWGILLS